MKPYRPGAIIIPPFHVTVLLYVEDKALRSTLELNGEYFSQPHLDPSLMRAPTQFKICFLSSKEELAQRLLSLFQGSPDAHAIVCSDRFLDGNLPSELALGINGGAMAFGQVATLIAIAPAEISRVQPIFRIVRSGIDLTYSLREALQAGATRQQLLAGDAPTEAPGIILKAVETAEEMRKCLRLRHQIFGALGYLPEFIETEISRLEMNYHDTTAYHLIAAEENTGRVVGTLRLVVPGTPTLNLPTLLGGSRDLYLHQQGIVKDLRNEIRNPDYSRKLRYSGPGLLPLVHEVSMTGRWKEILRQMGTSAESGRLTIHPHFRGVGLSTALLDVAMILAMDLRRTAVIGECLPRHLPMYERYGFQEMDGRRISLQPTVEHPVHPTEIVFDLLKQDRQAFERLKWKAELFRMANAGIASLREKISVPDLNRKVKSEVQA